MYTRQAKESFKFMAAPEEILQSVSGLFGVLSHPVRIKLLSFLRKQEMDVSQLQQALNISQSGASQHLALLKRSGLVVERRDGKHVYYRLKNPQIAQVVASALQLVALDVASGTETLSNILEALNMWGG